ncbi:small GTP-binding protein domain [Pelomyxa schiedti]|nr:small GTP-binding protein domain [Pelomyxa schiedti]
MRTADVICLLYDCTRGNAHDSILSFWIPEIRRECGRVPILLVETKSDLKSSSRGEPATPAIEHSVDSFVECSSKQFKSVVRVFQCSHKVYTHPISILLDRQLGKMHPLCEQALIRIFKLCDNDHDGVLDDFELNKFQMLCFREPLPASDLEKFKQSIHSTLPSGVDDLGRLTLAGFLFTQESFLKMGRYEQVWQVLNTFGYGHDLELSPVFLYKQVVVDSENEVCEPSAAALEFISHLCDLHNHQSQSFLSSDIESMFQIVPRNHHLMENYKSVYFDRCGNLTTEGFLALWWLKFSSDWKGALASLSYLGYSNPPATAVIVRPRRNIEMRKLFNIFVFGSRGCGKSSLLNTFIKRQFDPRYFPTVGNQRVCGPVQFRGTLKYAVLHEFPSDLQVAMQPSEMTGCDMACILYDQTCDFSFHHAARMCYILEKDYPHIPRALVATKVDNTSQSPNNEQAKTFCRTHNIPQPLFFSAKETNSALILTKLLSHLSHPPKASTQLRLHLRTLYFQQLVRTVPRAITFGVSALALALIASSILLRLWRRHKSR